VTNEKGREKREKAKVFKTNQTKKVNLEQTKKSQKSDMQKNA
jgi:hypothetical protein